MNQAELSRMTKTQFLTPALSRRTAGLAPARFVDTRGPPVPAARADHAALPMGRAAQATDTLRSLKCAAEPVSWMQHYEIRRDTHFAHIIPTDMQ